MSKELAKIIDETKILKFVQMDEFKTFINQAPPEQYIKKHPLATGVRYIPIDKIELMMDKIFQDWCVEILDSGQLLNSIFVTVRVKYKHPITNAIAWQDGVGAVAVQVDKGKNASDLGAIKSNAIMLGLPSAKSYAIKDAVEHIGKVFGRDLNRKDTLAFTPSYGTKDVKEEIEKKKAEIADELRKAKK